RRDPREPSAGRWQRPRARGAAPLPRRPRAARGGQVSAAPQRETPAFTRQAVAHLRLGPELLVGLDIDGTILGMDDSLSRRVRQSIARVVDSGARLVLATGRSLIAVLPVIERLGLR